MAFIKSNFSCYAKPPAEADFYDVPLKSAPLNRGVLVVFNYDFVHNLISVVNIHLYNNETFFPNIAIAVLRAGRLFLWI